MNSFNRILLAFSLAALSAFAAPIFDSFDGPTLGDQWVTYLPTEGSAISLSGGELVTQNRGMLVTASDYVAPYTISGVFALHDGLEHFNIALRTDLSPFGTYSECSGLIVTFVNDGHGICIQEYQSMSDQWSQLAYTPYDLATDQAYLFSLTDMGDSISLTLNGVNVLSAQTSFGTGNQISFYSREFGLGTSIDSLSIIDLPAQSQNTFRAASVEVSSQSVPDGGITALLVGLGVVSLAGAKRHTDHYISWQS